MADHDHNPCRRGGLMAGGDLIATSQGEHPEGPDAHRARKRLDAQLNRVRELLALAPVDYPSGEGAMEVVIAILEDTMRDLDLSHGLLKSMQVGFHVDGEGEG